MRILKSRLTGGLFILLFALMLAGCGGPSKEYVADAEALLVMMEEATKELESGIYGKEKGSKDREAIANHFVDETILGEGAIPAKWGEFERKWDAKDEGKLESFKLLNEAYESMSEARRQVSKAVLTDPRTLEGVFTDRYLACDKVVKKARRFLDEGK